MARAKFSNSGSGIVLFVVMMLVMVGCVQAQHWQSNIHPPASATITDGRNIWIVTEGPRAIGSPLSSYHIQGNPLNDRPLPPIVTPGSLQPLGGGYYQPNTGYVPGMPQYNPMTGQLE